MFDLLRDICAVIGALVVAALGFTATWALKDALTGWRARRDRQQRETEAAVDQLATDITAFELLTSARDVWGDGDD
ncbi:hypothetical protein ACIBQ1_09585 [Nonomuraea sp. NPDC050153]|uniref:hypothetical protein n=1 Tax=Nonomuraea sp. NPDC050153 TaxID=3364359 RepID=UPI00378C881F